MKVQKRQWGQIEWIHRQDDGGLNVGIVMMKVGSHHMPHKHYDEQVIYVLQGRANSIIDGKSEILEPGDFRYWKSGVIHEVFVMGEMPFVHLMVSCPTRLDINQEFTKIQKDVLVNTNRIESLLRDALTKLRGEFLDKINYPYTIFDCNGKLLLGGKLYPDVCIKLCGRKNMLKECPCMKRMLSKDFISETEIRCPKNVNIFSIPIKIQNQFAGYIQGGYFWERKSEDVLVENMYEVPKSTEVSMRIFLQKISKTIQTYCEYQQYQAELEEKIEEISSERELQQNLKEELRTAEYAMIDLRINNHFLFNTLNSMSAMALQGGLKELYQSIIDLAKMFKYALQNQNTKVTLKEELSYIRAYLHLQQIRYKENLIVNYEIDEKILDKIIPFNLLQPVVENAFIHGFSNENKKGIQIRIKKVDDFIVMEIINSGKELSEKEILNINEMIIKNNVHGLGMIYGKIRTEYGDKASLKASLCKGMSVSFQIKIPYCEVKGVEKYDSSDYL